MYVNMVFKMVLLTPYLGTLFIILVLMRSGDHPQLTLNLF